MVEIDGVRDALELQIWESGDYISDKYWQLLDLVTSPSRPSTFDKSRMRHLVDGLNRNLGTTVLLLDIASADERNVVIDNTLHTAYNSVVEQVNELLTPIPEVPHLELLSVGNIMARPAGSHRFIHP